METGVSRKKIVRVWASGITALCSTQVLTWTHFLMDRTLCVQIFSENFTLKKEQTR